MAYTKNQFRIAKHKDRKTIQAGAQLHISAAWTHKDSMFFLVEVGSFLVMVVVVS